MNNIKHIKPTRDHLLVAIQKAQKEQITKGGIVLSVNNTKPECKGKVIAVGTGRYLNNGELLPIHIAVNDIVLFYDYAGVIVEETETEIYMLLKENDIIAIIK